MHQPLIIAHRGASFDAEGNTLKAYRKAVEIGADMIELDVRRTKDNIFIAYHDEFIHGKPVKGFTYEEISHRMDTQGFRPPTVEEVLQMTQGKMKLDVELKEEGYENEMIRLLLRDLKEDAFIITSFNDKSLKTIKRYYPKVKVGLILGRDKPENILITGFSSLLSIKRGIKTNADILVLHFKLLKFGFLNLVKRNNIPVFVWIVNEKEMMMKFLNDHRIEAIITDHPALALSLRNRVTKADSDFMLLKSQSNLLI